MIKSMVNTKIFKEEGRVVDAMRPPNRSSTSVAINRCDSIR